MYAGISTIYLQGCYIESTLSAHWGETIVFPLALMIAVQWLAVLSPRDYLPIPLFSNHSLVRWFAGLGARARRQTPLLWSVWSLYELNPNHLRPRLCLASSLPPTHHRPHPAALLPSWLPPPLRLLVRRHCCPSPGLQGDADHRCMGHGWPRHRRWGHSDPAC